MGGKWKIGLGQQKWTEAHHNNNNIYSTPPGERQLLHWIVNTHYLATPLGRSYTAIRTRLADLPFDTREMVATVGHE